MLHLVLTYSHNFFTVTKRIWLAPFLQVKVSVVNSAGGSFCWNHSAGSFYSNYASESNLHLCWFWGGRFCYSYVGGSCNYTGGCFCCNYAVRSFCSTYVGDSFCSKCVGDSFYSNYAGGSCCYTYAGRIFCSALCTYAHHCFCCNNADDWFC